MRLRSLNLVVNKIVFQLYKFNSVCYDLVMHYQIYKIYTF